MPSNRYFEDVSHLSFGQEIPGPRVDGALSLDNCFHSYHIPRRPSFVRVFLYKSVKLLRGRRDPSRATAVNPAYAKCRKVKSRSQSCSQLTGQIGLIATDKQKHCHSRTNSCTPHRISSRAMENAGQTQRTKTSSGIYVPTRNAVSFSCARTSFALSTQSGAAQSRLDFHASF
jgi:hypothetical protein